MNSQTDQFYAGKDRRLNFSFKLTRFIAAEWEKFLSSVHRFPLALSSSRGKSSLRSQRSHGEPSMT